MPRKGSCWKCEEAAGGGGAALFYLRPAPPSARGSPRRRERSHLFQQPAGGGGPGVPVGQGPARRHGVERDEEGAGVGVRRGRSVERPQLARPGLVAFALETRLDEQRGVAGAMGEENHLV